MTDKYRYRLKTSPSSDFDDRQPTFATRDVAVDYALKTSKKSVPLYVYDTDSTPHRLVGCAQQGVWRIIVAKCKNKNCDAGYDRKEHEYCQSCDGLSGRLSSMPWRAG